MQPFRLKKSESKELESQVLSRANNMVTVENSTMSMPMKSSSEGVALSLWNKISEVQAAAEQCRIETRAAHEEYEKTQSSLDSLGHEEIEQVKATDDALQNAAEWSMRLHGGDGSKKSHCRSGGGVGAGGEGTQSTSPKSSPPLQRQWDRAQAEFTVALKVHREALHIGEQCKLYRQEQMRIAIEKSGRFRRQCHPLQHQVASIDATLIPFAATCAALGHATKDRSLFFNQANFSTTTVETPSEDENDPLTWVNFSGDPNDNQSALELLVQDYRWQQKAHTEAAHVLEQLESEQTQISMRCNQRQVRSHQLSLQLERLVADCDEVEMQTKHVQQMTIENQELARKFRCSTFILISRKTFPCKHFYSSHILMSLFPL